MNKQRYAKIESITEQLDLLHDELYDLLHEEEEARDNTPESLHDTERYMRSEIACEALESAADLINDVLEALSEIE